MTRKSNICSLIGVSALSLCCGLLCAISSKTASGGGKPSSITDAFILHINTFIISGCFSLFNGCPIQNDMSSSIGTFNKNKNSASTGAGSSHIRAAACLAVLSVLSGVFLKFIQLQLSAVISRLRSSSSSDRLALTMRYIAVAVQTLFMVFISVTCGLLIRLVTSYSGTSGLVSSEFRMSLLTCVVSTLIQAFILTDLVLSLSTLIRLHTSNDHMLLVETGSSTADDHHHHRDTSFSSPLPASRYATVSSSTGSPASEYIVQYEKKLNEEIVWVASDCCLMCNESSTKGTIVFGSVQSSSNSDPLEWCHCRCVFKKHVLNLSQDLQQQKQQENEKLPEWLDPLSSDIDGRLVFVWFYICFSSCIMQLSYSLQDLVLLVAARMRKAVQNRRTSFVVEACTELLPPSSTSSSSSGASRV